MPNVAWAEIVDYIPAPPTPPSRVSTVDSEDEKSLPFSRRTNPLQNASLPSIVLAHWIQPMVSLGAERVLELADMWPIGDSDSCDALEARFRRVYDSKPQIWGISPVAMAFAKTFRRELAIVLVGSVLYVVALAMQSYVAQSLLQFLNDRENIFGISDSYWLVVMMTSSSILAVCTVNYVFFTTSRVGANVRSLAMVLVFDKTLRLSSASRQEYTAGEVLTLMSVDAERIFTATLQSPWHIMGPLSFIVSIAMIGELLDAYSALAGAGVLVVVMWVSIKQGERIPRLQRRLLEVIEKRVKVTSEALQGIRVVKLYAWEEPLAQRVEKLRGREVDLLRKFHSFQVMNTVMLFLTPTFLSGVTLGLYVLLHSTIDTVEAFTLIAMVNICRTALFQLPQAISSFCKAKISLSRIDAFLASDEIFSDSPLLADTMRSESAAPSPTMVTLVSNDYTGDAALAGRGRISFRDASFRWLLSAGLVVVTPATAEVDSNRAPQPQSPSVRGKSKDVDLSTLVSSDIENSSIEGFHLEGINLEIERGSLVMIVGKVGSGKSSLVSAILGEMPRASGVLEINGQVAYVSQDTWIRNATLRDNILFEQEYDAERYERVLDASQLAMDLKALPNGDSTEIGERGINLSGGQKARVAIARAMYRSGTDVLILDDPLSAVDPHVAHAIFDKCIVGLAGGHTRLLVLNSHYDLLSSADLVVVLERGKVAAQGTYIEVLDQFPSLVDTATVAECDSRNAFRTEWTDKEADSAVPLIGEDEAESMNELEPTGQLILDEDRVRGSVSGQVYKTYFDESGFNGILVALVLSLAYCVSQAVRTLVDWWPGHWARNMTRFGVDPAYSGTAFGMWYLGLVVVCSILTLSRALTLIASCMRTSQNLHDQLFRRVLGAPITRYFDVTPVGRILNRFSNDLDQMDAVLPEEYQLLFQNVSMAVGTLVVSAFASYWIAVLYIPLLVIFEFMGGHFKKSSCELKRLEGITRTPVYNLFSETLSGLSTIRAFKMDSALSARNRQVVDRNSSVFLSYWGAGRWLASRLDLLSVVIIFSVTAYLVSARGKVGALTSGISLTYSLMLTSVVQWVMRSFDRTDNAMTSVERLLHFQEIDVEDAGGSTIKELVGGDSAPSWPSRGAIRFEGLCLRYRPELPLVLKGVDMDVAAGEKVGICGRTGAGKSSLMVALFRICDFDSGRVLIDDVDIASINLRELRRSLAIIPQDPVLFSGPLRENLDPFHEYSDERIWAVLQQVHMAESLRRWGAGLDFEVAEGGDNLSVGQRQLICIGRALMKDSKVVVLDEATANVDTATDALIQQTIQQTFAAKTVLVIAHRINTILHCDKIAVMDAGRVAEFGSPSELLARPQSMFAALAKKSGVE